MNFIKSSKFGFDRKYFIKNKNLINNLQEESIKNYITHCKAQIEKFYELKNEKEILDEIINIILNKR